MISARTPILGVVPLTEAVKAVARPPQYWTPSPAWRANEGTLAPPYVHVQNYRYVVRELLAAAGRSLDERVAAVVRGLAIAAVSVLGALPLETLAAEVHLLACRCIDIGETLALATDVKLATERARRVLDGTTGGKVSVLSESNEKASGSGRGDGEGGRGEGGRGGALERGAGSQGSKRSALPSSTIIALAR